MPEPTPRLGSLADTAPAAAPRMMSGLFQGVLDPAMRRQTEQEIGFFPLDPDAKRERFEQEIGFTSLWRNALLARMRLVIENMRSHDLVA